MLSLAFGLILYHVMVGFVLPVVFLLLVVIPVGMNLWDGGGYWYNLKMVFRAVGHLLRSAFGKRDRT